MATKLKAAVLAGFVIFVFEALSWTQLGIHSNIMKPSPVSDAEMKPIYEKFIASGDGMYHLPEMPTDPDDKEAIAVHGERYMNGPVFTFMNFRSKGGEVMPPINFLIGFLTQTIAAFIVALLINCS